MTIKEIYLIKSGLCCDDIVKSLKYFIKKNSTLLKEQKSSLLKLKNQNDYTLTENGIKEIINLKNNDKVKEIIKTNIVVLSAFEKGCIESSMVLFNNLKNNSNYNGYIYPILNISNNNFKSLRDIQDFKIDFGNNNTKNIYWEDLSSKSELLEIKKDVPIIDWKYTNSMIKSDFNTYNFSKFEKYLEKLFESKNTVLIIANSKFIIDFLKKIKDKKYVYDKVKDIVEYSSCYKIQIEVNKGILKYEKFEKIYPTKFNYMPLNKKNENYTYKFKNEIKLNNSMKYININELQKIFINRCISEKIVQNIIQNTKKSEDNKNNKNSKNKGSIMNLINKVNNQ